MMEMIKDFSNLAEASNIIDSIQKKAKTIFKSEIRILGKNVVEEISSYLSLFLGPLYDCPALKEHCLASVGGVSIINKNDYERYNQTKQMNQMFVLGLNIPLGIQGGRVYLTLTFRKNEPVQICGDINEMTIGLLIKHWHELKKNMENHCEKALSDFNRNCKYQIDVMSKLHDDATSFKA